MISLLFYIISSIFIVFFSSFFLIDFLITFFPDELFKKILFRLEILLLFSKVLRQFLCFCCILLDYLLFFCFTNLPLFFFFLFLLTKSITLFLYLIDAVLLSRTVQYIHARIYTCMYVDAFILTFTLYSFRVLYTVIKPRLLCLIKKCFINKKTNRQ